MATVNIGARVPEELNEQVTKLAGAIGRSRSWVIEEALRAYVASETQFIEAVQRGIEDAKAGRVTPHHEIVDNVNHIITEARNRRTQ